MRYQYRGVTSHIHWQLATDLIGIGDAPAQRHRCVHIYSRQRREQKCKGRNGMVQRLIKQKMNGMIQRQKDLMNSRSMD